MLSAPDKADPTSHSYYAATANRSADYPQLSGEIEADLCIVGAGFTGLAAALRAAEQGASVVVLEAVSPGFGASGRNGGQLIPGLRWDARTLVAEFGKTRAKEIFDLALSARDRVWGHILNHQIACDLAPRHIGLAWKPKDFEDFQDEAECLARDMAYPHIRILPKDAVGKYVASDLYHGGMVDDQGGHFHPLNYVLGLADAATTAGASIFNDSAVTAISENADGVEAVTAHGRVRAKQLLLANDSWIERLSPKLGRFAMPIMNYNIATAPLGKKRAQSLMPDGAAAADSRFVLNYFRMSPDHRLIFGGGEKYTPRPPASMAGFVRHHMLQVFPDLDDVAIDYAWGGAVGVSLNRLPQVGRSGRIWHAHGFSGHGALLTTLAGEAVADAIAGQGRDFEVLTSLPGKAFPGGPALRIPLHIAGMLYYALRDRL